MRDLRRSVQQNKAFVGLLAIDAMAVASSKRFVVEARFVAEKRELEPSLPANGSVTVGPCAPAHREDQADITNETDARQA